MHERESSLSRMTPRLCGKWSKETKYYNNDLRQVYEIIGVRNYESGKQIYF